jgi:hypothetical protein
MKAPVSENQDFDHRALPKLHRSVFFQTPPAEGFAAHPFNVWTGFRMRYCKDPPNAY